MRQQSPVLMPHLRGDYDAAKALGAPLLSCQGMLVPRAAPDMRLLFQSFPRPIVTNNDIAEVAYAGGLQSYVPGTPKTSYQGSVTLLETETGRVSQFAELILSLGGLTDCDYYDGRPGYFTRVYELQDCAFTFEPADGQADGRSQVMTISGSIQYMFFGMNAAIGGGQTAIPGQRAIDGMSSLLDRAKNVLKVVRKGADFAHSLKGLL